VTRLVLRRLLQAIPVLFGITVVSFVLVHLLHGEPARTILGVHATPAGVASLRRQLGLDESLPTQYVKFVGHALTGDIGHSFILGDSVGSIVVARLPVTLFLIAYAAVLAVLLGIPLALLSALRVGRPTDHVVRWTLVLLLGVPSFWLGIVLVVYPALKWHVFPSGGYGSGFAGHLGHLFLPALVLALSFLAVLVRSLRASLLEVLATDYVSLARLKGIGVGRLYRLHVLRTALRPAITIVGLNVSYLLGAAVVVESVFAINGIGGTLVAAIGARDYPLVQGITLVFGLVVLLITLTVDLIQIRLDPRQATT
jgi:ABC-type dipeptide/oligopeptide/nickel transport system permease component